jgi:hypothetical protein
MSFNEVQQRITGRCRRDFSRWFVRRMSKLCNRFPIISFTFDDFPKSALADGGAILRKYGARGTYYASFGLMNQNSPVGRIFSVEDLEVLVAQGHELGCHTFAHCHAWNTKPRVFEESILENGRAMDRLFPGVALKTLAYPIAGPRPGTKRRAGRHFLCCRGGGQIYNSGWADLNLLSAFFLEQSVHHPAVIEEMIRRNEEQNGWLIFATHDVCETPTRFGVTPGFFEKVTQAAAGSRCRVLRVSEACEEAFGLAGMKRAGEEVLLRPAGPTAPRT